MVNRLVIGAGYGTLGWLAQRISAVVMAVYTLFMVGFFLAQRPLQFYAWKSLFTPLSMRLFSLLFLVSLFLHAWIGVRNILMDYVAPAGLRLALEVAVILALLVYAAWSIQILWGS
jgi:succinate dehydrogenase / fumarate reductase membrane anchor subunit